MISNYDGDSPDTSGRDFAPTLTALKAHPPEDIHDDNLNEDEDNTQPIVTVERKALGTLEVSESSVTAGSLNDLTLTYKFTEDMEFPPENGNR